MDKIKDFFHRHKKIAFQFSSGKDSAAILWLLEEFWPKIDVIWINPGDPYPETIEYMKYIKSLVPHFFEVYGDVQKNIEKKGWPVDILPLSSTLDGMMFSGKSDILLRPFWSCCYENMWEPAESFVSSNGYDGVIRGQKKSDRLKGPIVSGTVANGIEYLFPIEEWNDRDVINYLGDRIPDSYKRGLKSSLDCMSCTAYVGENPGRLSDLKQISIVSWQKVCMVHLHLTEAFSLYSEKLRNCHAEEPTNAG